MASTSPPPEREPRERRRQPAKKRKNSLKAISKTSGVSRQELTDSLSFNDARKEECRLRSQTVGAFAKLCVDISDPLSGTYKKNLFLGDRERWCIDVRSHMTSRKEKRLVRNNISLTTPPKIAAQQIQTLKSDQILHTSSSWDKLFLRVAVFVKKQVLQSPQQDSVANCCKVASVVKKDNILGTYVIRPWHPQRQNSIIKYCFSSQTETVCSTDLLVTGIRVRGGRWFKLSEADERIIIERLLSWRSLLCPRVSLLRKRARKVQYEEAIHSGVLTLHRYIDDYVTEMMSDPRQEVSVATHTLTIIFRPDETSAECWRRMRKLFPNLRSLQIICCGNTPPLECPFYAEYLLSLGDTIPPTLTVLQISGFALHSKYVRDILTRDYSRLKVVVLTNNRLTDDSAFHLCTHLELSSSIKYLDVSENSFYEDGLRIICQGLSNNSSLTYLDVSKNPHEQESLLQTLMVPEERVRPGWDRRQHHLIERHQRLKIRSLVGGLHKNGVTLDLILCTLEYLTVYSRVLPLKIVCDLPYSFDSLRRVHVCDQPLPAFPEFSRGNEFLVELLAKEVVTAGIVTIVAISSLLAKVPFRRPAPPRRINAGNDAYRYKRWVYTRQATFNTVASEE